MKLFYTITLSTLLGCTPSVELKNPCPPKFGEEIFLIQIENVPYLYHDSSNGDLCTLIKEVGGLQVVFDLGCDNKFDYVGSGHTRLSRKEYNLSERIYFDNLLEQGKKLACLGGQQQNNL